MSLFTKPSTPNRGTFRGRWRGRGWRPRGRTTPSSPAASISSTPSQTSHPGILVRAVENEGPYQGWSIYFPDEMFNERSETVKQVQIFEKHFISWRQTYKFDDILKDRHIILDLNTLVNDRHTLPDLKEKLKQKPENIINSLGLAMHQLMVSELKLERRIPKIEVRITGYLPLTSLRHIKASYYGKYVSIRGTVVRVSNLKPMCMKMAYRCLNCDSVQVQSLQDGKHTMPSRCPAQGCRSRTFNPLRTSQYTECVDWQLIRVQETLTDDRRESGRIPRTVDCELTCDLVDSCVPGDVVTVSGVVKVTGSENKGNKDKCMFLLYINANSLVNSKGRSQAKGQLELTDLDMEAISEIRKEKNLFRFLVGSLAPSIYGHEMVKAGFVLALFGGSQRFTNDKNHVPVRGDPHVLVVGDPGLGKSQMLQAVSNVAPRSVYVCGNATTTSGLTVTLSKDGGNGDCALEAGALVLADQGCCCIDEFDKMGSQHSALLEAMEQQSISIAKAGIVCSLPARTSIIAAANPVGGHYNKAKTVSENLRMGSALLSRFDLVFIMLDKPDAEMDSMLSDHVMALHAGTSKGLPLPLLTPLDDSNAQPLSNRLKLQRGEAFEPLPAQLFRKYLSYARKKIHPKIGKDAAKILQNFYLELRKNHQTKDSTPITTRQLESLIRLTEARARLELRDEATQSDAEDVISIMKSSMIDTFSNEFGLLDFQRSQHGSGMSSKSQAKKLISLLNQVSERTTQCLFSLQQIKDIAAEAGLKFRDFDGLIASLNNQGYLLQKGNRLYQLQTSGL